MSSNVLARPEFLNVNAVADSAYAALESGLVFVAASDRSDDNPLVAVSAAFAALFEGQTHVDNVSNGLWNSLGRAWAQNGPEEVLPFLDSYRKEYLKGTTAAKLKAEQPKLRTQYDTISTYFSLLTRGLKAELSPADFPSKKEFQAACKKFEDAQKSDRSDDESSAEVDTAPADTMPSHAQYTQALLMVTAMMREGKSLPADLQGAVAELIAQAHKSLPVSKLTAEVAPM